MYHQNWLEEMDQIGYCNGGGIMRSSSNNNKMGDLCSSLSTATMNKSMGGGGRIRIRYKEGGGGWRSCYSGYCSNSCVFAVCWLILSVGSSMAVMAYQNDLSVISSSSSISALSSGTGKSNIANSRHSCVWSRTDSNAVATTAASSTTTSLSSMNGMYGNDPFHHQQQSQHTFPVLSPSSSAVSSPYYSSSVLTSGFSGGSSSTSGGNGVLVLNCNVRTLNADFQNYTSSFTREQVEQTKAARIKCSDKLFFESMLSPNQTIFQLRNLRQVQIDSCKIRKLPKGIFSAWTQLRELDIQTDNAQWFSAGMEISNGTFEGLSNLERLSLSRNGIYSLEPNALCPLKRMKFLNFSYNFLNDLEDIFRNNEEESCVVNIQSLDLSHNTLRRIHSNAFSSKLVSVDLSFNRLSELSDASFNGLAYIKLINLSSNHLVALPPNVFNTSTTLNSLYLQNNSISALSPRIFTGLEQLLLLNLSGNALKWVPDSIFSGLIRLIVLKISHNQLVSIDSTLFNDLISLQVLDLSNNRIETISPLAFQSLKNLVTLDLSKNSISQISSHLNSLFVLRNLYLDSNQLRQIDNHSLKNLTSLQDLGLANNALEKVPTGIPPRILSLDLGENTINTLNNESFEGMSQLIGLRLVGNRITELPEGFCKHLSKVTVLNLSSNMIQTISPSAFSGCPNLRVLRLDTNLLQEIPQLPISNQLLALNISSNNIRRATLLPSSLEWLDLSHNELSSLSLVKLENFMQPQQQHNSWNDRKNDSYNSKYSLRVLDASFNKLSFLDHAHIPPSLETLRLNHNKIKTVNLGTFIRATRLRRVELIGNEIEHLSLDSIRILAPFPKGQSLPEMFLGGNPFFCDCSMEWLTRMNQLAIHRQHPRIVDLDAIVCRPTFPKSDLSSSSSSWSTQVIPLVEADPSQFLCSYTSHCFALCMCCDYDACDCAQKCPDNCNCYHNTAWSSNIVQCSNANFSEIPSRIPMDATELYLDGNNFQDLNSHIFIGKKNLRALYLNSSQISTIRNKTFNGLRSLEILHLENNLIEQIHGFEFADLGATLREIYLQNNKLIFIKTDSFPPTTSVIRLDGNLLVNFPVWELTKTNGHLNSIMISQNPWTCNCDFISALRRWISSLTNTIVVDFALAKCQPTEEQLQHQRQQDGNGHNSSAGSTTTTTSTMTIIHPTISSMCIPQSSASSSDGGSNNVVMMRNHISSMGGAARSNLGSLQLSGPYHHAHLENKEGNYQQGFPQNENNIAGGGLRRSKADHGGSDDDDDGSTGNSTFYTCLATFIAIILVATIAFLVGLLTFRKRTQLTQSSSLSGWRACFSKCGVNGGTSAMPKCLSASKSCSTNEGSNSGTYGLGRNSVDMDDKEKLFDAYFIYSHKDEEFVTEKLTGELEREGNYFPASQSGTRKLRLCLHYRDLSLAPDNPWSSEMILSACDASKRVVVVLSNNFLNSEWTNNHFRTSVHNAIQQHCRKLIIIKLPQVSSNTKQASFTSSTTQLEWDDKNFWPKFRLMLPNSQITNRNEITSSNFTTMSSHGTTSSQLPYTTNLNPNGMNFINVANNGHIAPYQIPMLAPRHQQQDFITLMNWTGQQQQGIGGIPLNHSSSVHPVPSQLTPQHFGYINIDGYQNNINSLQQHQAIILHQQQQHFSLSNNIRHSQNMQHQQAHPHQNHPNIHNPLDPHGQHVHSFMVSSKSPVEANYSSSAISSGNEEFEHVYSTLDSPLESPCSDLGPSHVAGQFEGAICGAQVNRHQIQHSSSSGISSASDATSGTTGGCHPGVGNPGNVGGPPMYFV